MLKDFDLAFIDTEATGLGFNHELIEIGLVKVSSYNFTVLDEWEAKIKIERIEMADPEALKMNNYNETDWKDALDEEEVLKIFLEKAEKTILVGHNLTFDWLHIQKSLAKYSLKPTFWYKSLDTFSLAWQKIRNEPSINSLGLGELARYFEISQDKPHSALDDARTTYKVFMKLKDL